MWLFYLINSPKIIKRFVSQSFQRVRKGWAYQDTWSFDNHLSKVIGEGLIHLSNHSHGYAPDRESYEEWTGEMRFHGERIRDYRFIEDRYESTEDMAREYDKVKESLRWVADNFGNLWD